MRSKVSIDEVQSTNGKANQIGAYSHDTETNRNGYTIYEEMLRKKQESKQWEIKYRNPSLQRFAPRNTGQVLGSPFK